MSDANKAVFLSYASQDVEAARKICAGLRAASVEVWLDQSELVGGDAWDQKIRERIKQCALFLPIISANTQARREGYFRREWKQAAARTHDMADGTPFLLPVVIDATRDADALVPEEFRAVQWTRLPGGEANAAFCERVQALLAGDTAKRISDPPSEASLRDRAHQRSALPQRSRAPLWMGTVAALAVFAALALWQPWRRLPAADTSDKSIAVLPFVNQSDDKENTAFFSDGMHEDILTSLANIRDLKVISRTSVMEYRGTTKKIPQIARELGVAYILEGSVRRAGSQVRITGQLIRAATDEHVWAKSYDRELTPKEVFAIQAALATEIAGELKARLSPREKSSLARMPTENLEAYDLFLKAREVLNRERIGMAMLLKREKLLLRAVELDPTFATAWSELSRVQSFIYRQHEMTGARRLQGKSSIENAVRLAPDAPDVIRNLGSYYHSIDGDFVRAIEHYQRTLELLPNDADAYRLIANAKVRLGDTVGSIVAIRRAIELDPADVNFAGGLVTRLLGGRRYAEARAEQGRLVKLRPGAAEEAFELAYISFLADGSVAEVNTFLAQLPPAQRESPRMILLCKAWAATQLDVTEFQRLDRLQPYFDADSSSRFMETMLGAMVLAESDLPAARMRLSSLPSELRSRLNREPLNYWPWAALARVEAMMGSGEEALGCAQRAAELVNPNDQPIAADSAATLAFVHARTGRVDLALAELARQLSLVKTARVWNSEYAFGNVHEMRRHPAFAPLRNDPRFQALLNDPKNNAPLF